MNILSSDFVLCVGFLKMVSAKDCIIDFLSLSSGEKFSILFYSVLNYLLCVCTKEPDAFPSLIAQ